MDAQLNKGRAETLVHSRLKRLALLWAQAQGYSACALEVSLPQCRYRADVAAYRPNPSGVGLTAIFECKQALPDLRRDNCCSAADRARLEIVYRRRQILEKDLRLHYPNLRIADSLFFEFDSHDFAAIEHRGLCARFARVEYPAKSPLRLHQVRETNSLSLREFVLSRFA